MSETAIVKTGPVDGLSKYLSAREKNLGSYAANRIKPSRLIMLAVYEFANTEWLRRCSPESIYAAVVTAAQLGLEIGAAKGEAYLVPFKGQVALVPGWRGLIKLARRSREVRSIFAHVVYEADEFAIELGSDPRVTHRPTLGGDPGPVHGAYAVARLSTGDVDVEWMTVAQLDAIREASPAGKRGPWVEHTTEMYRKTVIRRLCKRLPVGEDYARGERAEHAYDTDKEQRPHVIDGVIDAETVEPPSPLKERVARAAEAP